MKSLLIDYFKDKDSFIDLQLDFLRKDCHDAYKVTGQLTRVLSKEDFFRHEHSFVPSKTFKEGDYADDYVSIIKVYFYRDYLPQLIKDISSNYLEDFYLYIRDYLIDDAKARRKFLYEQKKFLSNIYDDIEQFNFIEPSVFNELKAQIIEIEKAVNLPTLNNDKYLKSERLALIGWKEQDLLVFFNFLREQNVISPKVTDMDLGIFLERCFCVEKDDEVSSLDSLNKKLNYIKSGKKDIHKSEVRLKRLFDKL